MTVLTVLGLFLKAPGALFLLKTVIKLLLKPGKTGLKTGLKLLKLLK